MPQCMLGRWPVTGAVLIRKSQFQMNSRGERYSSQDWSIIHLSLSSFFWRMHTWMPVQREGSRGAFSNMELSGSWRWSVAQEQHSDLGFREEEKGQIEELPQILLIYHLKRRGPHYTTKEGSFQKWPHRKHGRELRLNSDFNSWRNYHFTRGCVINM